MSGIRRRARRFARRLGLDANPLRRRTDKIATWLAVQFLVVVLIGVPLFGIAAFSWAGRAGAAEQRAERSWREVPAVLLRAVPVPDSFAGSVFGYSWVPARWTAPDGRARSGDIPVEVGLAAGRTVRLWVDARGTPTDAPLTHRAVLADRRPAVDQEVPVPRLAAGDWTMQPRIQTVDPHRRPDTEQDRECQRAPAVTRT